MNENPVIEVRPAAEIQAAHDRLLAIILGEAPNPFPDREDELRAAADVLCWVLQHDHNESFRQNLEAIEAFMTSRGMSLQDTRELAIAARHGATVKH